MKKKTSITIEEELWKKFTIYTINKTGSARKISETMEQAINNLMNDSIVLSSEES